MACFAHGQAVRPGPAESLSGAELLRWRLQALEAIHRGQPERAAEIFQGLITADPAEHWSRTALIGEVNRVRLQDARTRRAIPAVPDIRFLGPAWLPQAFELEQWATARFPYVPTGDLLTCARLAEMRGDPGDAFSWYRMAIEVTHAGDPEFLSLVQSLLALTLRADGPSPRALRVLDELTGGFEFRSQDLYRTRDLLEAASHAPSRPVESARSLLQEAPLGRLGLALRIRLHELVPPAGTQESVPDWGALLLLSEDPLDTSGLLLQRALRQRALPDRHDSVRRDLRRALDLVPDSPLQARIGGQYLRLLCETGGPDEEVLDVLREHITPPACRWEGWIDSLQSALESLIEAGRESLVKQAIQLLLPVAREHPFVAHLLEVGGRVERDPRRRIELYRQCLREARPVDWLSEAPQIRASFDLARTFAELGLFRDAADPMARALALSPPPDPYRPDSYRPYADWLRWRLQSGEAPAAVAKDLVVLLTSGSRPGLSQEDEVWFLFLEGFSQEHERRSVVRALSRTRRDLAQRGVSREQLDFLERAQELATLDPAVLESTILVLHEKRDFADEQVYELIGRHAGEEQGSLTLLVLRTAARKPTGVDAARFASPPPDAVEQHLVRALRSASRSDDVETLCRALGPHPSSATRQAILERIPELHGAARRYLVRALASQVERANDLPPEELGLYEPLLPELMQGELGLLPVCMQVDAEAAYQALRQWFLRASSLEQRVSAVRQLHAVDPARGEDLLVSALSYPESAIRIAAMEATRRIQGELPEDVRLDLLETGTADPDAEIRWRAATCFARPLADREVRLLLELLRDPDDRVQELATSRLSLLQTQAHLLALAARVREYPELCDRSPVVQVISGLSGKPLSGLEQASEKERLDALDAILEGK